MTTSFYADLSVFTDFSSFTDFSAYTNVPENWIVMISDVVGSTNAIKAGRYKDVNMVGAASITAILNTCGNTQVPFVFGGDGGTVIVPPVLRDVACDALCALRDKSDEIFGLQLRVGAVPVSTLLEKGQSVKIRKFELSKGNFLAMFAGGGMELADELLKDKSPKNPFLLKNQPSTGEPDLEGLSCRWEPLQASQGKMLTMMIKATAKESKKERAQLSEIIASIDSALGGSAAKAAPASKKSMHFRWPPRGLQLEARMGSNNKPYWRRAARIAFTSLVQLWCEKFKKKAGDYDAVKYGNELRSNTDFRKFDGILRMVLDINDTQLAKIETYLASAMEKDQLIYGLHIADTALMTCMVFSLKQSEHIHFVDGSNGGFAMAAIDFKQRIKKLKTQELD